MYSGTFNAEAEFTTIPYNDNLDRLESVMLNLKNMDSVIL